MTTPRLTATTQPIFAPRPRPRLTQPIEIRDGVAIRPGVLSDDPAAIAPTSPMPPIFTERPAPTLLAAIPAMPTVPDLPQVVSIGSLIQGGRWRTEAMRAYSRPALYWFTRGQGRATIAGHTRGFTPHTAFMVPAGQMHGFELIGQVTGMLVFFPRDMAPRMDGIAPRLTFRDGQRQMELTGMVDALREAAHISDAHTEDALAHHASLLAIWLARAGGESVAQAKADLVGTYTAMIETDFAQGLTVSDYARRIGVTPTHLSRVCRTTSGRSAHALLTSRRLFEAQSRLAGGAAPVSEVGKASGFGSAAYFARAFRKATGQSPSAFRASATRQGMFPTS